MDLPGCVRRSCELVANEASHVVIHDDKIEALITDRDGEFADHLRMLIEKKNEWDVCGWHYNEDVHTSGDLTAQYILIVDALNFCFWPCEGLEYEHLALG